MENDKENKESDLLEMLKGPFYNPPHESPLEDLFAWNIVKYLDTSVQFQKQVEVKTICGVFRMDFVAIINSTKIAFECDGREFHNHWRDEWRDAMILGADAIDVIYRLRGSDLTYHLEDCLYVISRWNPEIFSSRGLINLEKLASDEALNFQDRDDSIAMLTYWKQSKGSEPLFIFVERRLRKIPPNQKSYLHNLFQYAQKHGGGNLDKLIEQHVKERSERIEATLECPD